MISGTIKFYSAEKGFGFITRDDGQEDAFFHVKQLAVSFLPAQGQRVQFEMNFNERSQRERADNVRLI